MKITFIGDIMLGRFVREKYEKKTYNLISDPVKLVLAESDYIIANLESPIIDSDESDSLKFAGSAQLLDQFRCVNCFSLSNNHINDFGERGMTDTIEALKSKGIEYNGLYETIYSPIIVEKQKERIAIVTCADMMNYEFSKNCPFKTLRVNRQDEIISYIKEYKQKGFFVIVYAHVGMLFTRFPNPVIRDFAHLLVDEGADCVVSAHPHCLGGSESYNDKLIVYSLGDFLMDGASFRRRKAGILNLEIDNGRIANWSIIPVFTNNELVVCLPDENEHQNMLDNFDYVSKKMMQHSEDYISFYKIQYKKEMIAHSWSTMSFEYNRRGLRGLFRILMKRIMAVRSMTRRMLTDRSTMSYDADAVSEHNISINDIR